MATPGFRAALRRAARGLWRLVKKWPVRAQALVVAAIACATAFGLGWNGVQVGAVSALSAAFLAFVTEQAVTSLEAPVLAEGTRFRVATPSGEPDRVETA